MDQKTLEASDSRACKLGDVLLIVGHHSSPSSPVHPAATFRSSPLGSQRVNAGSSRYAIQWHVHYAGNSAGGCSAGRGFESFPFRAARIIDVNVCVDKAGQHGGLPEIDNFSFCGDLVRGHDLADHFSFHEHASRTNALRGDNAPGKKSL